VSALTDGMLGLNDANDRLTVCACWRVKFSSYSIEPTVVVRPGTSLDGVEALGRRALFEAVTEHSSTANVETIRTKVAGLHVMLIERQQHVHLEPTLG
jgi:hypothetical protein